MKYFIVGIGNMGVKYDNICYNIGFDVLDYLVQLKDVSWCNDILGDVMEFKYCGCIFVLFKFFIYVNFSGKVVCYWL